MRTLGERKREMEMDKVRGLSYSPSFTSLLFHEIVGKRKEVENESRPSAAVSSDAAAAAVATTPAAAAGGRRRGRGRGRGGRQQPTSTTTATAAAAGKINSPKPSLFFDFPFHSITFLLSSFRYSSSNNNNSRYRPPQSVSILYHKNSLCIN